MKTNLIGILLFAAGTLYGQYAAVPSSSYSALDAILNGKLAVSAGAGVPSANCTQAKELYLNTSASSWYGCTATNIWSPLAAAGTGGTVTSVALALPAFITVSGSPVTGTGTLTGALATQTANAIFAGPTTGAAAAPGFRALVTADLPAITVSQVTSAFNITTANTLTNVVAPSTPAAGFGAVYVDSTSKALAVKNDAGAVSHTVQTKAAVANNYLTAIADDGTVTAARPVCANLSDAGTGCTATLAPIATSGSAADLSTGTIVAGRMPAYTGDATSSAGSVALVVGKLNGTTLSALGTGILKNTTGTGVPSIAVSGTDYDAPGAAAAAQAASAPAAGSASITTIGTLVAGTVPAARTSGFATVATSASAADLTAGTLPAARMPALTGDATSSAGSVALTVVKINGVTLSGLATGLLKNTTGTGVPTVAVAGTDYAPATPSVLISTSGPVADPGGPSVYQYNNAAGALTFTAPAGSVGLQRCYRNATGKSGIITIQMAASNTVDLQGANGSAAGTLVSTGALGDSVCIASDATNHWYAFVAFGTWSTT